MDFWQGDLMSNFLEFCVEIYREFRQTLAKMGRAIELETSKPVSLSLKEKKKVRH